MKWGRGSNATAKMRGGENMMAREERKGERKKRREGKVMAGMQR